MTLAKLVGDDVLVPCIDGTERTYLGLDAGASTAAFEAVAERVTEFLPWYSSVHRGAGRKSQVATQAYEDAREAMLAFAGRHNAARAGSDDVAIFCRNTTEAINILAHRLTFEPGDTIVTTVAEHHANLLPWQRIAHERGVTIRYVECDERGEFSADAVAEAIETAERPRFLAVTGATNVTGWMPPLAGIVDHAHRHGLEVLVDAAQLAPHRPLATSGAANADYLAWSGHKMYAPFGAGVLIGPRRTFETGSPLLVGGGAVNLVDLDEVLWTDPPEREEAGSPNVIGAVALHAAVDEFTRIGWDAIIEHELTMARKLRVGLADIADVDVLGEVPDLDDTAYLAVASFVVADDPAHHTLPHPLLAARLSAEHAIGVRHGCFCAHPYLVRLLGLSEQETARYRNDIVIGDRRNIPGAARASVSISTTPEDIDRFLLAVEQVIWDPAVPARYQQDPTTGDYWPVP